MPSRLFTATLRRWHLGLALGAVALLAACGGGGGAEAGRLSVRLTDSQGCSYKQVFVTVERVRVHRSATAADDDGGWQELLLSPTLRVDLMTLRNGVFEELGTLPLDAGDYSQVRLVLGSNGASAPFANQLTRADDSVVALSTPSGQQSGLKLNLHVTIQPGQLAELVLDFDPCKSVVKAGNSGNYNLKPVITAFAEPVNDIEGHTLAGAVVSAQQNGSSLKSTVAGSDGRFVLWPVAAGSYDLVITADGRANAVLSGVTVTSGTTVVSAAGTPLVPAASGSFRNVSGSVATGATEIDAAVSALQLLSGGTAIEAAATPVDALTGAYAFSLPTAAPGKADWVAGTLSYSFSADAPVAGLYSVRATAVGFPAAKEAAVNLGAADATGVDFVFP
ncbi:DUF4382 domain-containing protein [Methylibium sp.]|uniref:DUF4382 domain-containing protein n=1 Tax=Methylibium sp. TaxID=2067992 RepID=UPI003D0B834C